ncbi:hypothetical protein [Enterococcus olivae]
MEINIKSLDELQEFMKNNLLKKQDAMKVTNQSAQAFTNAERAGMFKPFYETDGTTSSKVKLYLRSDIEEYADNKRKI